MKKNNTLIICAAGDDSLHTEWFSEEKKYDLFIIYYGNDESISENFKKNSDFFVEKKGEKFYMVFDIAKEFESVINEYDYIWVPDCDLSIGVNELNEFFDISKKYDLYLSQPCQGGHISHLITMRENGCLLRFTSFVEIIAPLFKREIFYELMFTFNMTYSSAALDFIWPKILGYPKDKIAIIDKIQMIHTKPVGSNYDRFPRNPRYDFYENMERFDLIPEKGIQYAEIYSRVLLSEINNFKKKYTYCTIAIGEFYYKSAIQFAEKLNEISNTHKVLIVTDQETKKIENCEIVKIPNDSILFYPNGCFNYNLKYYPIKLLSESDNDFVIYIDSDWTVGSEYDENKIQRFLTEVYNGGFDFIFERPSYIIGKNDFNTCFWRHKIDIYGLMSTDKYDHGHVPNEQFLVFRVTEKLKKFVDKWEELNKICIETKTNPFAEGLEIGMSAVESDMSWSWGYLNIMSECFSFMAKNGQYYSRF